MADELIPITDEQAKAIQELAKLVTKGLEVSQGLGRFLREILGTVPENLVGVLGGDRLAAIRQENLERIAEEVQARRQARRMTAARRVSLTLAIPLIRAAADESEPQLQDLWARLMIAAMDPTRAGVVRRSFIDIVQQMEPIDALVLQKLYDHSNWSPNARNAIAEMFKTPQDRIEVSFGNLTKLGCIGLGDGMDGVNPTFTATGRELMRALRD